MKGMDVSISVIINLAEHSNELYALHFCNFFCHFLPLHVTHIHLTLFCLITCALVYSIIIWPTNWALLSCGMWCWDSVIFHKKVVSVVALMKTSNLTAHTLVNGMMGFQKKKKKKKKKAEGEDNGEGGEGDEEGSQAADPRITVIEIATGEFWIQVLMRSWNFNTEHFCNCYNV